MSRPATDWTGYQYSYLRIIGRGKSKELSEITGIGYTTLLYRLDHGCPLEHLTDTPGPTNRFTTF